MTNHEYHRITSNHCVYVKNFFDANFIILLLYVDEMLIVGRNAMKIDKSKKKLSKSFAMKDLDPARQFRRMKISRNRQNEKLWLSLEMFIVKVLDKFNISKVKEVSTPLVGHLKLGIKQCSKSETDKKDMRKIPYASAVGSLMYSMVCIRSDITHVVGMVSQYLSNHGKKH